MPGSVETRFNDLTLYSAPTATAVAGMVGDVVPVRVTFTADMDMDDVRVKISMEGHRDDVSASTSRFDIVQDSRYTKLLSLRLPSDSDILTEEYTLYVEIVSSSDRTEMEYTINMQRESYTLEILSVDYSSTVSAGDVFPVSVVAKNVGFDDADDVYVIASIPSLGVSTRGYMGDVVAQEVDDNGEDDADASYRTVYLKVPSNAERGVYEMEIEVYNDDSSTTVKKLISVDGSGSATTVLATSKNKDLNAGETVTYEMVIVNSANDVKVFNINAVSGDALKVSVPSAVAVGPDSSETVQITVTASDDASVGTYTFSVDVNGEQTVFGANVTGSSVSVSLVAWTVVLVVVFVVLLAVLIVLVTRREKPIEEVETSYY
ncbi:MAG: hypothetical protein NUV97_02175 [archaeon]|nr:hypothetical protein [archaeon]MCR4323756.1 hypothetical protein [Nanoarchaeota archaeon]